MKHSVEEVVLTNGMRGLLVDVPDATVMSFRFHLRAGDYFAPIDQYESAHIMEHMVLGANERFRTSRKFNAEFQKNGAYNNAMTGYVSMYYVAECADFEWERILELLVLSISKPYFTQEEFKAEYGNVHEELTGFLNNHNRVLFSELNKAFDPTGRLKTDADRLELMKNVDTAAVKTHYKKTHRSDNFRFVIAGNMKGRRKQIERLLESADLERGERFAFPGDTIRSLDSALYVERKEVKNLSFDLSTFKMERISEEEQYALHLVDTMLTATLHSLILGEARERGLAYYVWSTFDMGSNNTSWDFGAEVSKKNIEQLFDIMTFQLRKILDGDIDKDDIEMAKQYRLGAFQMGAQTVGSFVRSYGSRYFYDETITDYDNIPDHIKAVTKTQMVKVVQEMFEDDVWGLGVLGSCGTEYAEKLREKLQILWR
ncbi:MAG TPA: insulinase family protein [Candidatus Saccharimonadales bacterium]|nr:insulinase family protein [Candidatus Saccharimonadales bacterium]